MDMSEIKKRREAANKRQRDMIRKRNEILAKSKAEKKAKKEAAALKRKNLKETQGNLKGQQAAIKLGDTENRKGKQTAIPASKAQTKRLGTVATVAAIQAIPVGTIVNGIARVSKNLYKIGQKTYKTAEAAKKAAEARRISLSPRAIQKAKNVAKTVLSPKAMARNLTGKTPKPKSTPVAKPKPVA